MVHSARKGRGQVAQVDRRRAPLCDAATPEADTFTIGVILGWESAHSSPDAGVVRKRLQDAIIGMSLYR